MMKTLNYFLCILAILVLTRCRKQIIADPVVKPVISKNISSSLDSYPGYNTNPLPPDQTGMTSTAAQLAANMTLGINIGNTMEASPNENGWGNPNITQGLIDSYKQKGFNAVRIPCNWNWSHIINTSTEQIDPAWLSRVQQVVQYCVNDGMYVILNIHWDGGWLENNCTTTAQVAVNAKQKALWEQIATQMRGFDQHLLFASANEPNASDTTGMRVLLSYHQTFVNAVRSTGGHNSYRTLVVQGPNTNPDQTYSLMNTLPTDPASNRMMVEVHQYAPYNFCIMPSDQSWGNVFYYWGAGYHTTFDVAHNPTWGEESTISGYFQEMQSKFTSKGIPVVMGEFGVQTQNQLRGDSANFNLASRAYWYNFNVHTALAYGMLPFFWDTGGLFSRSNYGVLDQRDLAALAQGKQTGSSQTFSVGSVYQIINRYSFKPLEIAGWGSANGSLADQWDYLAGQNQQFKVQSAANGSYLLTPMHTSGKCLEVLGWSGANGGTVDIWSYSGTGGNNQNWLIQATDNGYYKIINVNSGKALEVASGSSPAIPLRNGSAVDQSDYTGGKNQQWAFLKL